MEEKACIPLTPICFRNRFLYLFVSLLLMHLVGPLVEGFPYLRILFNVFVTAILISAVYAISQGRKHILLGLFFVLPALAFTWIIFFINNFAMFLLSQLSIIAFFVFIIIRILLFISAEDEVTLDLIIGAAVVYLLLAYMWSYVYQIIERLQPGSFAMPEGQLRDSRYLFLHYSLVTITTLGYGDVSPLTTVASSFSTLEAIVGQLYLVITVAWLVGMHVSQSKGKNSR